MATSPVATNGDRHPKHARREAIARTFLIMNGHFGRSASIPLAEVYNGRKYDPLHVPAVVTDCGPIEGFYMDGVSHFLGIPYARPPVGELRWHRPVPVASWTEWRKCTSYGPRCPQGSGSCYSTYPELDKASEDCLYLNVWRVQGCKGKPVIVFFHGNSVDHEGNFAAGSGSEIAYNGAQLAKKGAVVVTFNYRLGAFGFIAHPEIGANFGLWDQRAALGWIQRNIYQFGGDPNNVTLLGSSTGAESVRRLMSLPPGSRTFHRAILQSGGFESPIHTRSLTYTEAAKVTLELFNDLGTHDIDQLRSIPTLIVHGASQVVLARHSGHPLLHIPKRQVPVVWGPVVEDDDFDRFIERCPNHIPLMLGCTSNEVQYAEVRQRWTYNQSLCDVKATREIPRILPEILKAVARNFFGPFTRRVYDTVWQGDQSDCLDRLLTAAHFLEPCLATARRRLASGGPVYVYHFTRYRKRVEETTRPNSRSASNYIHDRALPKHASEIPYVFGNLLQVYGANSDGKVDPVDHDISEEMQHAWLTFARYGVPLLKDGSTWPKFNETSLSTVWFGDAVMKGSYPQLSGLIKMLEEERHCREADSSQVLNEQAEEDATPAIALEGVARDYP